MTRFVILTLLILMFLVGCGSIRANVVGEAQGDRELFVNLVNDPLLISIDLLTFLEARGYDVALSTEESKLSEVRDVEGGQQIHWNVSKASQRYELILGYQPIQDRIQLISASVRDRRENKILGTYRWSWSQMVPAPTINRALEMIEENLLSKIFR